MTVKLRCRHGVTVSESLTALCEPGLNPHTVTTTKKTWAERYFWRKTAGNDVNISIGKEELCCSIGEPSYFTASKNYSKASCPRRNWEYGKGKYRIYMFDSVTEKPPYTNPEKD